MVRQNKNAKQNLNSSVYYLIPYQQISAIHQYMRVSSNEQSERQNMNSQILDIKKRIKQIQDFRLSVGLKEVPVYEYEEYASAWKPFETRPVLNDLLNKLTQNSVIICYSIDRAFRSLVDFYQVTEKYVKPKKSGFIFTSENIDPTNPQGSFILNVKLSVAKYQSDQTSVKIKASLAYRKSVLGLHVGGKKGRRYVKKEYRPVFDKFISIMQNLDVNDTNVNIMKRLNIHNHTFYEWRKRYLTVKVPELYKEGMTIDQLAIKYKIDPSQIEEYLSLQTNKIEKL